LPFPVRPAQARVVCLQGLTWAAENARDYSGGLASFKAGVAGQKQGNPVNPMVNLSDLFASA